MRQTEVPLFFHLYRDEDIARLGDKHFNALVQREAARIFAPYSPSDHVWDSDPPTEDTETCRECFHWGRYGPGQRHFGYRWALVCGDMHGGYRCPHEHHKHEIWMAVGMPLSEQLAGV